MVDDRTTPERPRVEPEIIPPGSAQRRSPWQTQGFGQQRIYVTKLGPFGFVLLLLALAALIAVILLVVVGAVLIWIPILAVLVVGAAIFGRLRR